MFLVYFHSPSSVSRTRRLRVVAVVQEVTQGSDRRASSQ